MVFLRLICSHRDTPLFTHQQLAQVVGSSNRQASSRHMEIFRECVGDFLDFLRHRRKADGKVVSTVFAQLQKDPLATRGDLKTQANAQLQSTGISETNIDVALQQISAKQIRQPMQKQLARGRAHYREEYLLQEMVTSLNSGAAQKAGIGGCHSARMGVSDPTAVRKLISPEAELSNIDKPLKWISFLMVLYYHGVLCRC